MVAPTRTPQARGVKCDLCKKILSQARWLDQTKLAKEVREAESVLQLIKQHNLIECPCIPKNIENLLVGSTHFEIHRLIAKQLDAEVHKRQSECYLKTKQRAKNVTPKSKKQIINDCYDSEKGSRFKTYQEYGDKKHVEHSERQLVHLNLAIDFWQVAMEDQTHPFNSKLAHRLGLTHHIIYACYLYKYYKILDYQLRATNLLYNLFRSIEGVTANAILHSQFLLIRTLIDCDQLQLARHHLKQAFRSSNHPDTCHYEAILLQCISCELNLLEGHLNVNSQLDELADLAKIRPDDKLQHYYARTLAINTLIKYIHYHHFKSRFCLEFFHTYRYICAIIRRCYESSFELVLAEKESCNRLAKTRDTKQILDYSWIKYAVCDFVFASFEQLVDFYLRAGMPECLELLYNGLNLISYRNGGLFWQSKLALIGSRLDLACDKYSDAEEKLKIASCLLGHSYKYAYYPHLANLLRLQAEIGSIMLQNRQNSVIDQKVIFNILDKVKDYRTSLCDDLKKVKLFDCKTTTETEPVHSRQQDTNIVLNFSTGDTILLALKLGVTSAMTDNRPESACELINELGSFLATNKWHPFTYSGHQVILEMLLKIAEVDRSNQKLLAALNESRVFLDVEAGCLDLQECLSRLKLSDEPIKRMYNLADAVISISKMTGEEIVMTYLKHSEPNPDYDLYRRAHELMLTYKMMDDKPDHGAILYHFSESIATNTMRYRWMMMEEKRASPFDISETDGNTTDEPASLYSLRHLSFCNVLVNQEKVLRSWAIPKKIRLVQLKYLIDKDTELEHLLCVSLKSTNEPSFMHVKRTLVPDELFSDLSTNGDRISELTLPERLSAAIDASKQSLMKSSHRTRTELRRKIETDLSVILHDIENEWLGPHRFVLCGDICDMSYNRFTSSLLDDLQGTVMLGRECRSPATLRLVIENAPLLSRTEFCRLIASLFSCSLDSEQPRQYFSKWQKAFESFMQSNDLGSNKMNYLNSLKRGHIGLILDKGLESIPFESLPLLRVSNQSLFRVPSLRLFTMIASRSYSRQVHTADLAYLLDPANNLAKTRERFDRKLLAQKDWVGTIGREPDTNHLQEWLSRRSIYLFIGHGAGTAYYNKLCNGHGLSHMPRIRSAAIIMGCSSGRMLAEGPLLEPFGIGWVFILRGAPCYLGLLWDVTDNDIDAYLDTLLDTWMPSLAWSKPTKSTLATKGRLLTDVAAQARHSCQLKLLVGAAPVVYGLPIWCVNNPDEIGLY